MLKVNDVVMCSIQSEDMHIGSYGIVKKVHGRMVEVELAASINKSGSIVILKDIGCLAKIGTAYRFFKNT